MADEFPDKMANLVRRRFKGSSGKITKAKAKEVVEDLSIENPQWWHAGNRNEVFLARFSKRFPECVDGAPKLQGGAADTKTPIEAPQKTLGQNRKVIEINLIHVLLVVVVMVILWVIIF